MHRTIPTIRSASLFVPDETDEGGPIRTVGLYEIEYCLVDGGVLYINGQQHTLRKGNIIIAKPGYRRRLVAKPFSCLYIHLEDVEGEVMQILDAVPPVLYSDDRYYEETFQSVIKLFLSSRAGDDLIASGKLLQMIGKLSQLQIFPTEYISSANRVVAKAMKYININYSATINVDDIARHCNVSPSYLHKIFSKIRGTTPYEAIIDRRIMEAKHLLMNTTLTSSRIAERCGFHSQAYFSSCFRRKTGTTPTQFRQQTSYHL